MSVPVRTADLTVVPAGVSPVRAALKRALGLSLDAVDLCSTALKAHAYALEADAAHDRYLQSARRAASLGYHDSQASGCACHVRFARAAELLLAAEQTDAIEDTRYGLAAQIVEKVRGLLRRCNGLLDGLLTTRRPRGEGRR